MGRVRSLQVARLLRDLAAGLLDAALPQTCAACGKWIAFGTGLVCDTCDAEVGRQLELPYCRRCGRTLARSAIHADGCARCKTEPFWNVAGVARAGLYTPALQALLVGLKYRGRQRNVEYLADRLSEALHAAGWAGRLEALVPVPMHWLRRIQRPCDHARVLADALSTRLKVPVVPAVQRARYSPSQTGIASKTARFENIRGCFAPRPWYAWPWIRGVHRGRAVCIVDNLMATGATVTEMSKVLRRAGARAIFAAIVARPAAPGDPPAELPDAASDE